MNKLKENHSIGISLKEEVETVQSWWLIRAKQTENGDGKHKKPFKICVETQLISLTKECLQNNESRI
jgi:hypothetical protein